MREDTSLTPQEVADILKIAKNTVYELIKRGELNAYRVGRKVRVDMQDVEEYKTSQKKISSKKAISFHPEMTVPALPVNELTWDEIQQSPPSRGFVLCGQDIMLDILSRYMEVHPNGTQTFRSYTGSYNGLYALYHGNVQVATAHLWDGDSGQYNIPYVRRMLPGIPTVIVHLACRMQGFYVSKNNPKKIKDWEDLRRNDITMINREKGCGTRILLDEHLRLLGIPGSSIPGYSRECVSHLAAASTIARGGADIAIGNEKTSLQVQGIDFIPLQKERFELVIRKEDLQKKNFQALLEIIRSEDFKLELFGIGGYDLSETGKIVAEI